MRAIKFRGFNNSNSEWTYGNLVIVGDEYHITDQEECEEVSEYTLVDKNSIGQFTGLYDIDGKEIYEGDVVVRENDKKDSDKYKVEFKQGMFLMRIYEYKSPSFFALNFYIRSDRKIKWSIKSEEDRLNCNKVLLKVIGYTYEKE